MTNLTLDEKKALIRMALDAREQAYVPYSDFMVGAALRAEDGRIFTGCNVENAAFTPTSCAERTALFKAVADGVTEFTDDFIERSMDELLPFGFGPSNVAGNKAVEE